jgi:molybdopterin-guanine dinucleotide biosynthesis protein A
MTSGEHNGHQKHAKLKRPQLGNYGRNEIAIMGTPCGNIKQLSSYLINTLNKIGTIGFVDADHQATEQEGSQYLSFTDKISFRRFDYLNQFNTFQIRPLFNHCELVLVNGNHFKAAAQILVIDPKKPLERKLDRITNAILVVKKEEGVEIPDYLRPYTKDQPELTWDDQEGIADFIKKWLTDRMPKLRGLVLAGGKSVRMKMDKGGLQYHGITQRKYLYNQLQELGIDSFISCRPEQVTQIDEGLPMLPDTFNNLGPMGALLTAFREDPDSACLAIACDLPFLTVDTIKYLIENRDTSKLATAFQSPYDEFPEPLITIWEPNSYDVLLNFLSQGYSCPRKVLINSDVRLLQPPNPNDLSNVNHPKEYEEAVRKLSIDN